jgi:hypothetical protein
MRAHLYTHGHQNQARDRALQVRRVKLQHSPIYPKASTRAFETLLLDPGREDWMDRASCSHGLDNRALDGAWELGQGNINVP